MNQGRNFLVLILVACFSLAPAFAWADIYRYVDARGTVHFSNVPTDNRYKIYIRSGHTSRPRARYDERLYHPIIKEKAKRYAVDFDLVRAVIRAESDFCPTAVSCKGAQGLMQLMPETAQDMAVRNVFSPEENIEGGVKYLRRLLDMFNNNLPLSLAAYNAGENAVKECNNRIPPYAETQDYVRKVLLYLKDYKSTTLRSRKK